jgi:hypothetical protein
MAEVSHGVLISETNMPFKISLASQVDFHASTFEARGSRYRCPGVGQDAKPCRFRGATDESGEMKNGNY